jgi:hypothetical protein
LGASGIVGSQKKKPSQEAHISKNLSVIVRNISEPANKYSVDPKLAGNQAI